MLVGFDLDGVIYPDIKPGGFYHYLNIRNEIYPIFNPTDMPFDSVIITARPKCDMVYTKRHLREHGINVPIIHPDTDEILTKEEAATFKRIKCHEIGVDLYIESSRQIADLINAENTHKIAYTIFDMIGEGIEKTFKLSGNDRTDTNR